MYFKRLTIMVKDLEKSIYFYERIAELKIMRRFKVGPGEIAFMARDAGETEIELVYMPGGNTLDCKGIVICFETEKLDEVRKLAIDMELNPSDIRNPDPQNKYFYVYDPDKMSVEFTQKM